MNCNSICNFSYAHLRYIFETALSCGYQVITISEYFTGAYDPEKKILINRVDVDGDPSRFWEVGKIFTSLRINGCFYFRLHAPAYNLLRFDTIDLVRWLAANGNEIGLHSDIEDLRRLCGIEPKQALATELAVFRDVLGCEVFGIASHGDITGYNNLHFWRDHSPKDFGLLYEAYDDRIWLNCRYISDSNYAWKSYDDGQLRSGDHRCACQHFPEGSPVVYLVTHGESFFWRYVHESGAPSPEELAGA